MDRPKARLFAAAQWILAAAIIVFALRALGGQWAAVSGRMSRLDLLWGPIAMATALVFAAYALLIQVWRRMVGSSGVLIPFLPAARIWFVSNLGKYVPGKIWSIASMALLAREQGVAASSATASAVLVQLASLASGVAVIMIMSSRVLDSPLLALVITVAALLALASSPWTIPYGARLVRRVSGREIAVPAISTSSLWLAVAGSAIAWLIYGIAFRMFSFGVTGRSAGGLAPYIAVYAASYIAGFLAFFAPGGAVVREGALIAGMTRLGLATAPEAVIIALASRVWLTATELVPGFIALAVSRRSGTTPSGHHGSIE